MDSNHVKEIVKPSDVAFRYLGKPARQNNLGLWYKSPFRNERTASFLVNNDKGIHDFGSSKHYDIISFVQELFNIDFKLALKQICSDFGIIEEDSSSSELTKYLIQRKKEELEIKQRIDNWFNQTYSRLCNKYKELKKIANIFERNLRNNEENTGLALSIIYKQISNLEITIEDFINANGEKDKFELWKNRRNIVDD